MKTLWQGKSLEEYIGWTDSEVLSAANRAVQDAALPGHRDARALLMRKERFRALLLDPFVTEERLKALGVPEEERGWELPRERGEGRGLPFPVRRKNGKIQEGSTLSHLSVPSLSESYLYVSAAYEGKVRQELSCSV
jgi:hypothetical protein